MSFSTMSFSNLFLGGIFSMLVGFLTSDVAVWIHRRWRDKDFRGKPFEVSHALLRLAFLFSQLGALLLLNKCLKHGPTHATLKRAIALIPGHKLRKRLAKLLAEEAHHASELRKAGRPRAARWIEITTWALAVWYVVSAPATALWNVVADKPGAAK